MHTETDTAFDHTTRTAVPRFLLGCLAAVAAVGLPGVATTAPVDDRTPATPAVIADHPGGIAARLHAADGTPLPGNVFLLIGPSEAGAEARVYDTTPYTHDRGVHPDTEASNLLANRVVRTITGSEIPLVEMTHASAGGPSGGLTRAIAYLDIVSDGEFTGDLRVAATGQLSSEGHLRGIDHIDAKAAAADLADVDVLFTPTLPTKQTLEAHAARLVGEIARDPHMGGALNDPRRLAAFRQWGADRPVGMDVVDARHLIDVSAYLCGTGSTFACEVTESLDQLAQQRLDDLTAQASSELHRLRVAGGRP